MYTACRQYSVASSLAELDASTLTVETTKSPKQLTPKEKLVFGHTMSGNPHLVWLDLPDRSYVDN